MLRAAKGRAAKLGLPFNLTAEDVAIPMRCPALDIPIIVGSPSASDNSPSLDRLRPEFGYVRGNVLVLSNRANRIKNNASPYELRRLADFLEEHMRRRWMVQTENTP